MSNYLIKLDANQAQSLLTTLFGSSAYLTGSLAYGPIDHQSDDIDFIIWKEEFQRRAESYPVVWKEGKYFPDSCRKAHLFGIDFNAILLDEDGWAEWLKATEMYKCAPDVMKTGNKKDRIDTFNYFKKLAHASYL